MKADCQAQRAATSKCEADNKDSRDNGSGWGQVIGAALAVATGGTSLLLSAGSCVVGGAVGKAVAPQKDCGPLPNCPGAMTWEEVSSNPGSPKASPDWPQSDEELMQYYVALVDPNTNPNRLLPWGWHFASVKENEFRIKLEMVKRCILPTRSSKASRDWPQSDEEMLTYYRVAHDQHSDPSKRWPWGWHTNAVKGSAAAIDAEVTRRGLLPSAEEMPSSVRGEL